jgi:hypothetical protein
MTVVIQNESYKVGDIVTGRYVQLSTLILVDGERIQARCKNEVTMKLEF